MNYFGARLSKREVLVEEKEAWTEVLLGKGREVGAYVLDEKAE